MFIQLLTLDTINTGAKNSNLQLAQHYYLYIKTLCVQFVLIINHLLDHS